MMDLATKRRVGAELRALGWTNRRGLWRTEKRGLKTHTKYGLLIEEAASIEAIDFSRRAWR